MPKHRHIKTPGGCHFSTQPCETPGLEASKKIYLETHRCEEMCVETSHNVQQSLYRSITGPEGSKRLRLPDF
jgi:hypothetical protein